jgi:hypothetical protein
MEKGKQIKELKSQGKSYEEIKAILNCSLSTICYHLRPDQKQKVLKRRNQHRYNKKTKLNNSVGGKCQICGYNKYQGALHFHHIDPSQKKFTLSDATARRKYSQEEIDNEIKKCVLVCANCHAEIHAKLIHLKNGASIQT